MKEITDIEPIIVLSGVILFFTGVLAAQPAQGGVFFSQSVGAGINPLGILLDTRLFYRLPLGNRQGRLWEGRRIDCGLRNELTPTDEHPALFFAIVPVAFFEVTVKGGPYLLYDHLGFGYHRFPDGSSVYNPDVVDTMESATAGGYRIMLNPVFKLKLASVIAMHAFTLDWIDLGAGDEFYLDRRTYTLRKNRDVNYSNDTFLLYEFSRRFMSGVTYRNLRVPSYDFTSHRFCAVLIFTTATRRFQRVYAILMAGTYARDLVLYRKPYVALKGGFDIRVDGKDAS